MQTKIFVFQLYIFSISLSFQECFPACLSNDLQFSGSGGEFYFGMNLHIFSQLLLFFFYVRMITVLHALHLLSSIKYILQILYQSFFFSCTHE